MSVASSSTQLPKGWRRVAIKDMADSIQYGMTASAAERKDGPRFLRITDIQDGRVDWSTVPSCDISKADIPKYRLSSGDLVFARTGATTGKSFLIGECPEAVFASYLIRVRVSADVDSRYLSAFFQSPDYWQQIESYIAERTGAMFSHAVCPECFRDKVQPDLEAHGIQMDYPTEKQPPKAVRVRQDDTLGL